MLVVSFSGGKSSAYMARRIQTEHTGDVMFLFANTGQEREETLEFIHRCETHWDLPVVWVEAVTNERGIGTSHRIVSYETASRDGAPFRGMIEKYGIPNKSYPHCTRELKLAPMESYMRDLRTTGYVYAVGIRADEPKRIRKDAAKAGIVYPLAHWWPVDKQDVNNWWEDQPFNLNLKEHEGNCAWCWKKSLSKHIRLIREVPQIYEFPRTMEAAHGYTNARHGRRVFFRENRSVDDLFALRDMVGPGELPPLADPDTDSGCSESCDINAEIGAEQK